MKVRIDAGGREVEVETADANVTPETIAKLALGLWAQTGDGGERLGAPYGFAAQERREAVSGWVDFSLGEMPGVNARENTGEAVA